MMYITTVALCVSVGSQIVVYHYSVVVGGSTYPVRSIQIFQAVIAHLNTHIQACHFINSVRFYV